MEKISVGKVIRKTVMTLLLLAVIGFAGFIGYTSLKEQYTRTFNGYTASVRNITTTLQFSGKLALIDSAEYTAQNAATVRRIYVSEGAEVKEGDRLLRLSDGTLFKADFDGRIDQVRVAQGDDVETGTSLMTLADFRHMKLSFRVDEYKIGSISLGQECTIKMTASGLTFPATVKSIDHVNTTGNSLTYYMVTMDVEPAEGCYPGMQATAEFTETAAQNTVTLRRSALSFDENNSAYVWKMNEAGEPEKCIVTIGAYNDNYAEILSGVSAKETIYKEEEKTSSAKGLMGLFSSFGSRFGNSRNSRSSWSGQSTRNSQNTRNNRNSDGGGWERPSWN